MDIKKVKLEFEKVDGALFKPSKFKDSPALLYQENSKLTQKDFRLLGYSVSGFNNPFIHERASQPYKVYNGSKIFSLDEYKKYPPPEINFFKCIGNRRSVRDYKDYKISLNELFLILHYSYGISGWAKISNADGHWSYRNVPSGGGLYPLEIYIVIYNAQIPSGIYHYRPDINALEYIKEGDFLPELRITASAEPIVNIKKSSCTIIVTSIFGRTMIKYGERGYRFIMLEIGFVSENISLICDGLGLGSCMAGGYLDNEINDMLEIDGTFETVQNVIIVGKK